MEALTVCRFALQLERSRMAQYGIALQYLPTVNSSLYSPSLFSSSGGTYSGSFLNGDDTRINLSASYRFDTQLTTWNAYKDRKADYENTKREVSAAIMDHKHKLHQLRRSMQDYYSWRSYMQKRMKYLETTPVTTADEQLTRDKGLLDMKRELLSQEKSAIESEVALLVEYGMP
jgi:chromosome segregation ATPase